ncbi:MAG TPA: hypothetical protein VGK38_06670 [Prolixibacteraceae bacterium]|jgi:hypothetical protein
MQEKVQKNFIDPKEVAELSKKLRRGDNILIADMLDGLYKPTTIYHMLKGYRKMKPIVYGAATKLIETLESLKPEPK